jgi:hypothetical protein
MKKEIPMQLTVGLGILAIGAMLLGGEFIWVRWAPVHRQHVFDETLKQIPFHNDALGIDVQVAAGIYGKSESFPGGVRISRLGFFGKGPTLTITSEPNLDHTFEFTPEAVAKWMTDGDYLSIPRYHFDQSKIEGRDAVIIRRYKDHAMLTTARIISSDRFIVAECSTGGDDEELYLQACDDTVRSIKVAGAEPPPKTAPGLDEVLAPTPSSPKGPSSH